MRLNYVKEYFLNVRLGMLSFIAQRMTGLGLVLYLLIHLYSIGTARFGGEDTFNRTMKIYDSPFFHVLEWLLFLAVFFHLVNGIRIVLADFFGLTRYHKPMFVGVLVIVILAAVASIPIFL